VTAQDEVLRAAQQLVDAFGSHDRPAYFASFADEATFVFHNFPDTIESRADYEAIWATWEQEGFHVEGCLSLDQRVRLVTPDVAIFTHRVRTSLAGETSPQRERESIVFRREPTGRWLGIHEHLSVDPQ
jgi:ketosteroid isomerase-like protein